MATVLETTTTRNPVRAYYANLFNEAGYLTQGDDDVILFLAHGSTTPHVMTPEDCMWVVVNGEVGTATAAFVADQLAGGYAAIACSREEGRS